MAPEWTTGRTVALEPPRPVRIEQRGGSTVVVKSYLGTDGAAVHEALAGLWASPLGREREGGPGMPEPLGFDSRSGELTIAWVPGTRLAERGRVGAAVSRAVEVGNLLADLHGSGVVVEPSGADRQDARPVGGTTAGDVAADRHARRAWSRRSSRRSLAVDRAWAQDDTSAAPRLSARATCRTTAGRSYCDRGLSALRRPAPDPSDRSSEVGGSALSLRAAPGGSARPRGRGSARVAAVWR